MKPRIFFGLIFGILGMLPSICASGLLGICGAALIIILAGGAGLLTGIREKAQTRVDGGKAGAIAGAITGVLIFVGQLLQLLLGMALTANTQSSDLRSVLGQFATLIIGTLIIGSISVLLGVGVGASAAFITTPSSQAAKNQADAVP